VVVKLIGQQLFKYGKKRVSKYLKRTTPADKSVGASSKGPVPKDKISKVQSTLGGGEYNVVKGKQTPVFSSQSETERFQDAVRNLIGIDNVTNRLIMKNLTKKNKKNK
jgi:hypothetical protein